MTVEEVKADEYVPQPCGTNGAYQRHRKNGETPCDACRAAKREYHREYRKKTGPDRDRAYNRAKWRAVQRLIDLHPGQFQILMDQEVGNEP